MAFDAIAAAAVDAVFDYLGEAAVYHPSAGPAESVTILRQRRPEILGGFGATEHRHDGALFEVRAAGFPIAAPGSGDLVVTADATWRVRSVRTADTGGMVAVLDCEPF